MAGEKALSSDVDERIQQLAGDIYVQVEESILALLEAQKANQDIAEQDIINHPSYQALSAKTLAQLEAHQSQLKTHQQQHQADEKRITQLQSEINLLKQAVESADEFNHAKLSDSETILKGKLTEMAALSSDYKALQASFEQETAEKCAVVADLAELKQAHASLQAQYEQLDKNEHAKGATLAVQNQQISELKNQLDTLSAELSLEKSNKEYANAEQTKDTEQHLEKIATLTKQLAEKDNQYQQLLMEKEKITIEQSALASNVKQLTEANASELSQINALKAQLVEQQNEAAQAQQALHAQQLANENNQTEQTALQAHIDKLLAELQVFNEKATLQETTIVQLTKEKEENATIIAKQAAELENLTADKQHLLADQQKLNELTGRLTTRENELANEVKLKAALKSDNQALQNKLTELEKQLTKQRDDYVALNEHLTKIASTLKQTEQSLVTEQSQTAQLQADAASNLKHMQETQAHDREMTVELSRFKESLASTQHELKERTSQCQTLAQELELANQENVQLNQRMEADNKRLQADMSTLRKETEQLKSRIKFKDDEHDKTAQSLLAIQEKLSQATENNGKLTQEIDQYRGQTEKLTEQLNHEKATLAKVQARVDGHKEKQEAEYDKARETIKYLRDENNALQAEFSEKVSSLEDQIREYRLRFEYAQKQLEKQQT